METRYNVENGTKFKIETISLYTLYQFGSYGRKGEESEINSAKGFLQRLAQKLEWNRHDRRRAKAYMRSLVKGSGLLDAFVVVPCNLVLSSVMKNMIDAEGEGLLAWEAVKKYIEERIEKGAKFFIIDGQNRLNESIVPFFNNKMPFGDEAIVFAGDDGSRVNVAGKKFKKLPGPIQDIIKEIKVPFVIATAGDIEQFSAALIWKNEGIAWDEWQKLLTDMWYTKFRRQISSIASKDDGDAFSCSALDRVSGAKFAYDVNGYDLIVAQLLVWMETRTQPKNADEFSNFFDGKKIITDRQVSLLKKYLKELDMKYSKAQITNTELRNYVMLRYAIDNPKKFPNIAVPSWNIENGVAFCGVFKSINDQLVKDPTVYGETESYTVFKSKSGLTSRSKKPGSYLYYNSESKPDWLEARLEILINVLTDVNGKLPSSLKEVLFDQNTVIKIDTSNMSTLEELWVANPNDSNGNAIPISTLKSSNFDRGHKVAKSKGGSNTDLVIQNKRENRQMQEDYVASSE
jgi:hypothetical protein